MDQGRSVVILVLWRGREIKVEINPHSNVKELGLKLLEPTRIRADTMKLLVPSSTNKGSKLLVPFSAEHSDLSLQEANILAGKPIRMMGAFENEVDEVSQNNSKPDLRIIGFDEEEKRIKRRLSNGPAASLKLPKGAYIFCDFRTLHIPGIELNPPPSEALKRMHMLACDPGIVAIMNKHRWRVGIMTEMAPEGYVGISPKCILGFNMNHGEEISLRLRTDDLKGFRKYESIKKTLLHELAHMVYSEHDANFFALNKQLNEEAESLDWTKSTSHTLNGKRFSNINEEDFYVDRTTPSTGQKIGGAIVSKSARAASVAAAYSRIMNTFTDSQNVTELKTQNDAIYVTEKQKEITIQKYDLDSKTVMIQDKRDAGPDPDDSHSTEKHEMLIECQKQLPKVPFNWERLSEPDPDKALLSGTLQYEEPDPDDSIQNNVCSGPDPVNEFEPNLSDSGCLGNALLINPGKARVETSPWISLDSTEYVEPDSDELQKSESEKFEPDPDDSVNEPVNRVLRKTYESIAEPDQTDSMQESENPVWRCKELADEPDPVDCMEVFENQELQRIEEPVAVICRRIHSAIEMLRSEAAAGEASFIFQTLFKIIRNVIEHPDNPKFRRIRKANPSFQKNVANYKAAMEILALIGFYEDVVIDEVGRSEAYMVLRRNDPGLLWLAKSSLEVSIA